MSDFSFESEKHLCNTKLIRPAFTFLKEKMEKKKQKTKENSPDPTELTEPSADENCIKNELN